MADNVLSLDQRVNRVTKGIHLVLEGANDKEMTQMTDQERADVQKIAKGACLIWDGLQGAVT